MVKMLIDWWDRVTAEDRRRRLSDGEQMIAMRTDRDTA
jgi:hypothetical protein